MVQFDFLIVLIALVGNLFLGLFTLLKNPKSTTNKLFFFFTITMALYNIFNDLALHQSTDLATLFWIRSVISIALLINLLFFLFVNIFPDNKLRLRHIILWPSVLFTVFLLPLTHTNLIFKEVIPSTTQPVPGFGMPLFVLDNLIFLGGGFVILIKKLRSSHGIAKTQLKFVLLATIVMFILILLTNFLFVILLNTTAFVGLLPIYTLIFIGIVSYAIIKHRFLDISLLVARTVSFTLLVVIFAVFYAVLFALISSVFISTSMSSGTITVSTVLAIIMVFTFQPVRRLLEKITDKAFYKDHYNINDLLYNLTYIMASTLRLEDLTHQVLQELLKQMRVSRGVFILIQEDKIYEVAQEGYDKVPELDESKIMSLLSQNNTLVFEEMPESDLKETMRNLDFSIVVHLVAEGNRIGLLALGSHLSGDIYTSEDIRVLEISAPGVAVAIENSKSYEEIRRFNITLKEEVDQATKSLKEANTRLQHIDKLKDEFVSLASHELRTPMTVIKSYIWLLLQGKSGQLSDKQMLYLDRAYSSTNRLINLVNDMLNISRIESGRLVIDKKAVDIKGLISDVITEMAPKAQEEGVNLAAPDKQNLIPSVIADPDRIKEVLINLIGNSLKFTPRDGKITVTLTSKDGEVIVEVADTGTGINKEDIQKLFQKFGVVGSSYLRKQNTQGTGLGLYLSKSLIELHGGRLWAESEGEGKGSNFYFTLKIDNGENKKLLEDEYN